MSLELKRFNGKPCSQWLVKLNLLRLSATPKGHCMWNPYARVIALTVGLSGFIAVVANCNAQSPLQPINDVSRRASSERGTEEQDNESELETDRDSFTPSTSIASLRRTIVESSFSVIDHSVGKDTYSYPELLLRYGLTSQVEARFGWNYEIGGVNTISSGNEVELHGDKEEASRLLYGIKWGIAEQEGLIPEGAMILQGLTPTSGEFTATAISLTPVIGWQLREGLKYDLSCRYQTSENDLDEFNVWTPSSVLKYSFCEQWTAHIEYIGVFTDGREHETEQHFFSPGVHRLLNSDLEIGARVGWGLNDETPDFFANIGVGWRY
jgi:hypothetical protein